MFATKFVAVNESLPNAPAGAERAAKSQLQHRKAIQ